MSFPYNPVIPSVPGVLSHQSAVKNGFSTIVSQNFWDVSGAATATPQLNTTPVSFQTAYNQTNLATQATTTLLSLPLGQTYQPGYYLISVPVGVPQFGGTPPTNPVNFIFQIAAPGSTTDCPGYVYLWDGTTSFVGLNTFYITGVLHITTPTNTLNLNLVNPSTQAGMNVSGGNVFQFGSITTL